MSKTPGIQNESSALACVYEYHDRSKHHLRRYARALGYLDWASQPDPFRRYEYSTGYRLEQSPVSPMPSYDTLFNPCQGAPDQLDLSSISRLFYESLAISAWKQAGNNRWSLRVNPSSGDLHPTEAYLISGPISRLHETAAVYHYSPFAHALERRVTLTNEEWASISQGLPAGSLLIVLASIYWRESWKYGERAYRYCHHDVGHAIGALAFAAAALGWRTRLIQSVTDNHLAQLTGIARQEGMEAEHPDCLLLVCPGEVRTDLPAPEFKLPAPLLDRLRNTPYEGRPNKLSNGHHAWPVIDEVANACRVSNPVESPPASMDKTGPAPVPLSLRDRQVSARKIIRQRRSAVAMDGRGSIDRETFYIMMTHVCPGPENRVLNVLTWRPCVALALFVHRVEGLPAGLYLLARHPGQEASLRQALRADYLWIKPSSCPDHLPFYLLQEGDFRAVARTVSCHQDIAANGVFSLGMLAEFDTTLEQRGALFYPRLFWETGIVGQVLYLEAEAAGIRSTGIGCFFDDAMHEVLGIKDHRWQDLYHFTVGRAVDDPRLQTLPAYWHLK